MDDNHLPMYDNMLIQYCLNFFQLPYWDVLGRPGFFNTDIAV